MVDPGGSRRADVLVKGEVVAEVGEGRALRAPAGADVLDASGCLVAPGLVDVHAHLREPGAEEAESIETGARAAALGGYTAVVAMPNTSPPADSAAVVRQVLQLAKGACCDVRPAGTITLGREGRVLSPMAELAALGVTLFTDDGAGVEDPGLMRRAMEYVSVLGGVIADHCEDASLVGAGVVNEGAMSSALGLPGRPAVAEEVMVLRDLALARLTGARLHLLHLSAAASVAAVRAAKAAGVQVSAEVTPHHLALTQDWLAGYSTAFKVNPPLRTSADLTALREGLAEGTIDVIATDHAPHPPEAKDTSMCEAAPGMVGLETALAVALTVLLDPPGRLGPPGGLGPPGRLGPPGPLHPGDSLVGGPQASEGHWTGLPFGRLLAAMSWVPAKIAGLSGLHGGPVAPGAPANLCVVDPARKWVVRPEKLASRSHNTPFAGQELRGKVRHTLLAGEPVVVGEEAQR